MGYTLGILCLFCKIHLVGQEPLVGYVHCHVYINPCPAEPRYALHLQNSVDPDQLASDMDLHCLSLSMYTSICIKLFDQVI